jgi:tetratricopeptide (TPR) repeat protein
VWNQLATFAVRTERYDVAIDAYKHVIELSPSDPNGYIGAAAIYLRLKKLDDAREHASLAVDIAPERDVRSKASAHELLATIALARYDLDTAREEAELARKADPALPLPTFVEARILYDEGRYADALPLFEQTISDLKRPGSPQITELHFYAADTLGRLERYPEAEKEFHDELRLYPQNARARAGLAMLYQATDRSELAAKTIDDLLRVTPTPESYALAARLWSMFGNPQQANAVRAEARRAFADPARAGTHAARH